MTAAHLPSEINTRWADAFNAGDLPAMLELYEADAVLVPSPGARAVSGLDAIESSMRWLVGLGGRIAFEPRYWAAARRPGDGRHRLSPHRRHR